MTNQVFILDASDVLERLDKLLACKFPSHSRTYFQHLIDEGFVLLNGKPIKKRELPKQGDLISLTFTPRPEISLEPEEIPLEILYEDEHLLAINKPSSMVVHPGKGQPNHTFVNALLFHVKDLSRDDPIRPGIVHRLDKDTSGVLIAAKTPLAHMRLVDLFKKREMHKQYIAICKGNPSFQGVFSKPIGRDPYHREKMSIQEGGKEAITEIRSLAKDSTTSIVSLKPRTGRTHQLRVHLKHLGAPILYDPIYGTKGSDSDRLLLHALRLNFIHPITNEPLSLVAPLPTPFHPWFKKLHTSLENL